MISRYILILLGLVLVVPVGVVVGQSREDCLACHSDESLTTERNGREISLYTDEQVLKKSPHARLVCVACHVGFRAEEMPHKENITPVRCSTCHADAPARHRFHPQIAEAGGADDSPDVSCTGCHGTHDVVRTDRPSFPYAGQRMVESCGSCHGDVSAPFAGSDHGKALAAGVKGAPDCLSCHRAEVPRTGPGSDTASVKRAGEKLCLSCHLDNPDVRARTSTSAGFIMAYEKSVHGAALLAGNPDAAACVDCHGSHEMRKGSDPQSSVHKSNIVRTCSTCHAEISEEFRQSTHGVAVERGNFAAPVCTDCHGEHDILSPDDPKSPVAPLNISGQTCSPCHESLRLSEKYGLSPDRFMTFTDSYHGLAVKGGSVSVANCASCHGAHTIKPSTDPTSMVHKDNLAATCGSCHPGANERFAVGRVHVSISRPGEPLLQWVATFYLVVIVATIGSMTIHNAADFLRKSRRKLLVRRGELQEEHYGHRLYLRMTLNERLQHGTMALSFILLAFTGFMLRYPDAWWVEWIRGLSAEVFDIRSLLHRIAGVAMVAVGLYHVYYILFTERGRGLIRDLLPQLQDGRDALAMLRYNFGFSGEKPKLGRFSYIEKAEYWALIWGTVVMAVTGVILWFDNTFLGLLTKQGWDVARAIHFYEAWLAVLAIIVWHFYFVIFNPDIYPVNLAFWKGTLTEHEMADEHPLELEEIKRREGMRDVIEVDARTEAPGGEREDRSA